MSDTSKRDLRYVAVYFSILYMRHRAGIVTDEMLTIPKWRFAVIGMLEALGVVTGMYSAGAMCNEHFEKGDPLQVKVNKLFSVKTQLPYHYYYLNYCKPKHIQNSAENLGILDNLPVAVLRQRRDESQSTTYERGFRVGFKGNYAGSKEDKYFINDHLSFRVMYHEDLETDSARIVVFEVTPNRTIPCKILDNLPVAVLRQRRDESQSTTYEHGFRVGFKGNYAGRVTEGLESLVSGDLDFVLGKDGAKILIVMPFYASLLIMDIQRKSGVGNSCVGAAASCWGAGKAAAKQVEEL
ncbi:transmembrane 9 superfamily member 7-like protein [Tanacetum coccineum]|uniref:Transmembrane 9 superfamily member 7-like protein n=1 Tax=Tanacetum coccineum TaxID=301880 RepID=A0ABQ5IPG5_9ASTR